MSIPSENPATRKGLPELDRVTLERARRGERDAQTALIRRYQRPVFALLSRMFRRGGDVDRPLVEDIAQESFVRVLGALQRFDPSGNAKLSTWVLTIASRRAIDELRRSANQRHEPPDPERLQASERADAESHRRRLAAALDAAISQLSPEYRAAFVLREFHELSYREVADALDVDLGTVKSRISRAKRQLRTLLAEVHHAHD